MTEHMDEHHDHQHEEEQEQVYVITDSEGNEHEMVIVYQFETGESQYAVLLDRNAPEDDGVIFRIEMKDDDGYLVSIDDDEEWDRVVRIYNEIVKNAN